MSLEHSDIQSLRAAILAEAQQDAAEILADARSRAQSVQRQAHEQENAQQEAILDQGRQKAEALCSQVLETVQAHDALCWPYLAWGRAALLQGDPSRAIDHFRQAVGHAHHGEDRPGIAWGIEHLAWALAADGQAGGAARLLALADRERDAMGMVIYPVDRPYHDEAMETVREALGEQAFATTWAEAQALSPDEAVEQALGAEPVCLSRG